MTTVAKRPDRSRSFNCAVKKRGNSVFSLKMHADRMRARHRPDGIEQIALSAGLPLGGEKPGRILHSANNKLFTILPLYSRRRQPP